MTFTDVATGKEVLTKAQFDVLPAAAKALYQVQVTATSAQTNQRRELYGQDLAAWYASQLSKGTLRGAPGVPAQYRVDGWAGELNLKSLQIVETPDGATTRFVATHADGSTFKGSISPQNPPSRFPEKGDTVSVLVRTYTRNDGQTAYVCDIVEPGA